jgi:hypothetical protein
MTNATTHYQTSFRVQSPDADTFMRVKAIVYGWVLEKEGDRIVREKKGDFFFRCEWPNLYQTHSMIETCTLLTETGNAWAMHYMELDKGCGRQRYWYTDIGAKKDGAEVVVSVRVSYARNMEDLSGEREEPSPTVPKVVRYLLRGNKAYCGRPEFRLMEKPLVLDTVGQGKVLAEFITSPERRYPLIVFNGSGEAQVEEARKLAWDVAGKSQVVIVATNPDLGEELRHYLGQDYWVSFGYFRVFFPFNQRRNSPSRHRWYGIGSGDYAEQREGVVHGLLRNHILQERYAVETLWDVNRQIARERLLKLKTADPEQQKELEEFFKLNAEVEKERDNFKAEAASYASEVDRLEGQLNEVRGECATYKDRLQRLGRDGESKGVAEIFKTLPSSLAEVARAAGLAFPRLVITERAIKSAEDFRECVCVGEAWEILVHLSETLHPLKFRDGEKDLQRVFRERTGYELGITEGKMTKDDKELVRLRKVVHGGKEFDMTPHVKHGNQGAKLVRVHFAFDEENKKVVVGHIGKHVDNYTTKNM